MGFHLYLGAHAKNTGKQVYRQKSHPEGWQSGVYKNRLEVIHLSKNLLKKLKGFIF